MYPGKDFRKIMKKFGKKFFSQNFGADKTPGSDQTSPFGGIEGIKDLINQFMPQVDVRIERDSASPAQEKRGGYGKWGNPENWGTWGNCENWGKWGGKEGHQYGHHGRKGDKIKQEVRKQLEEMMPQIWCSLNADSNLPNDEEGKFEVHTHSSYTCDGCETKPIMGNRYRCQVCSDFDFCSKCHQTIDHEHTFTKIKSEKQADNSCKKESTETKPEGHCHWKRGHGKGKGRHGGHHGAKPWMKLLENFMNCEAPSEEVKEQRQWPGREKRVIVVSKPETFECTSGKIALLTIIFQNGTKWPWNNGHTVRLMKGP